MNVDIYKWVVCVILTRCPYVTRFQDFRNLTTFYLLGHIYFLVRFFKVNIFCQNVCKNPYELCFHIKERLKFIIHKNNFQWSFHFCTFFFDDVHGQVFLSVRNIFLEFQKNCDLPHNLIFNQPHMFIFGEHI